MRLHTVSLLDMKPHAVHQSTFYKNMVFRAFFCEHAAKNLLELRPLQIEPAH